MDAYSVGVITKVTRAMEEKGETPASLAKKTGIPRPTLIRSLDGHRPLNTAELHSISAALGTAVGSLVRPVAS